MILEIFKNNETVKIGAYYMFSKILKNFSKLFSKILKISK